MPKTQPDKPLNLRANITKRRPPSPETRAKLSEAQLALHRAAGRGGPKDAYYLRGEHEDFERWRAAAAARGVTFADWVRTTLSLGADFALGTKT
jgi:hypothetical protein